MPPDCGLGLTGWLLWAASVAAVRLQVPCLSLRQPDSSLSALNTVRSKPLQLHKAGCEGAYKPAGSGFRAASAGQCPALRPAVQGPSFQLYVAVLYNELLSMGAGGRGGRNELQWIVFWPQLRSGDSTWLGSAGRAECHQTVNLDLAVLRCVCCYKCCAGPCERVTIHRLRQTHVALRTGGSTSRARRLVASHE